MEVPYSRTIIGGLPWYSVLVVCGIALAVWLAGREEKRLGLPVDTAVDLALVLVPCGVLGARLYYVLMSWEQFAADPISALYVWQGGLAIYGGVIGGAAGAFFYAIRKKLSFLTIADMIAPGLLLAQAVGRWGNYFNMEAYGVQILEPALQFFPLAVYIPAQQGWFAATFFYESAWNLAGFTALWLMRTKQRKPGNVFAWYLLIYGAGRFAIEQLRLDSLYIGSLRASQWLSLVLCAFAAFVLLKRARSRKNMAGPVICVAMLLGRWGLLQVHWAYGLLLLGYGIAALWLCRNRRRTLTLTLAALMLDGTGLMLAITGKPIAQAAQGIHAALCSMTLPMIAGALCTGRKD